MSDFELDAAELAESPPKYRQRFPLKPIGMADGGYAAGLSAKEKADVEARAREWQEEQFLYADDDKTDDDPEDTVHKVWHQV